MSKVSGGRPSADELALSIGAARAGIGAVLLAAPGLVKILGIDAATAKRTQFLTRMTAARDVGIGVGTLASRGTPQNALWLAVGAAADTVDAVAIAGAARSGLLRRVPAAAGVLLAVGGAVTGAWAAVAARRG